MFDLIKAYCQLLRNITFAYVLLLQYVWLFCFMILVFEDMAWLLHMAAPKLGLCSVLWVY